MINKLIYKHHYVNYWLIALLIFITNIFFYFNNYNNAEILFRFYYDFSYSLKIKPNIILSLNILFAIFSAYALININKLYHEHFSITFPSFIFVLLANTIPLFRVNTLILFFFPVIIFLIQSLFKASENKYIYKLLFNFGFILGILSLINIYILLLLPILFFWLIYFRQFKLKEYLLPIVAFLIPYLISDAIFFIITNNENYTFINAKHFNFVYDNSFKPYFSIIILLFLFIFSLYRGIYKTNPLKKIKNRIYYNWILLSTLYLWIIFLLSFNQIIFFSIILFSCIFASITIISFKKNTYSKLFVISLLLINFISVLINI